MSETKLEVMHAPPLPPPAAPGPFTGVNVEVLMEKAIAMNSTVGVEVIERLMKLRQEAKAEWAKEQFNAALAAFQAECPIIKKTEEVHERDSERVRYRYAPLDAIVAQVKGLLQKHGFSHREDALVEGDMVTASCRIQHTAGHSEVSTFKVPVDPKAFMNAQQKFASALTYGKRYAFCCALGILTGDGDDDANSAGEPGTTPPKGRQAPRATPRAKPSPGPTQTANAPGKPAGAQKPPPAAEDARALVKELRALFGNPKFEPELVRYLQTVQSASGRVLLMPNEGLEDLTAGDARSLVTHWDRALPAIELWLKDHPAPAPQAGTPVAEDEGWRNAIVPIPRKGMKRDDYLKSPDTLGALYDAAPTDPEAGKRLFGLANNFEPSRTWVGSDGNPRNRSADEYEAELDFRDALDAFLAWHDKKASKSPDL